MRKHEADSAFSFRGWLPALPGFVALLVYMVYLYQHALNMPKWDDMLDVLYFMELWTDAGTYSEKLQAFLYHTNDHILLVNHLVFITFYSLFGDINFRHLIFAGNIFFIGSALVFWLFFKTHPLRQWLFSIIVLCTIHLAFWESTFWAMTSISNQAVIFFSLASIYLLLKTSKIAYLAALICILLAVFSQSNGFIAGFIGILLLYQSQHPGRITRLLGLTLFMSALLALYLFLHDPASKTEVDTFSQLSALIPVAWKSLPGLLVYLGGIWVIQENSFALYIASAIGLLVLGVLLYYSRKIIAASPLRYPVLFFSLTAISVALLPTLVFGLDAALTPRYKMYAAYLFTCALLLAGGLFPVENTRTTLPDKKLKRRAWLLIAIVAGLNVLSYQQNHPARTFTDDELLESYLLWLEDGDIGRSSAYMIGNADRFLFATEKRDFYTLYAIVPDSMQNVTVSEIDHCEFDQSETMEPGIFSINHRRNAYAIVLNFLSPDEPAREIRTVYLCPPKANKNRAYRLDINERFYHLNQGRDILTAFIHREKIPPGKYEVYIEFTGNQGSAYHYRNLFDNKPNRR